MISSILAMKYIYWCLAFFIILGGLSKNIHAYQGSTIKWIDIAHTVIKIINQKSQNERSKWKKIAQNVQILLQKKSETMNEKKKNIINDIVNHLNAYYKNPNDKEKEELYTKYFQEFNQEAYSFGADNTTFEIIRWNYSKDKNEVYHIAEPIPNVDSKTFEVLSAPKETYYYYHTLEKEYNNEYWELLSYARDSQNIYYFWWKVEWADTNSFRVITPEIWADKEWVYFQRNKIKNTDSQSIKALQHWYAKDNINVYHRDQQNWWVIVWADSSTFRQLSPLLSIDKNNVFIHYKASVFFSPDEFTVIRSDKSEVLVQYQWKYYLIEEAYNHLSENEIKNGSILDAEWIAKITQITNEQAVKLTKKYDWNDTWESSKWNIDELSWKYRVDNQSAYYNNKTILHSNPSTFKIINKHYAKDDNFVYYKGEKIFNYDSIYDEKTNNYYDVIISYADPWTFTILRDYIWRDKHFIYLGNSYIPFFDTQSFSILQKDNTDYPLYWKDKNGIFRIEQ